MNTFIINSTKVETDKFNNIIENDVDMEIDIENINEDKYNYESDTEEENGITDEEEFLYELDKVIENGDIDYLKNVMKFYSSKIQKCYLDIGEDIMFQILSEKMEDM